jgi:hypothetical protein
MGEGDLRPLLGAATGQRKGILMPKKPQTPFDKIMFTRTKLRLFVEYGDQALQGQTVPEFAADVAECFEYLMAFRNIINGMVSFDEPPARAVLPYLDYPGGEHESP